MKKLFYLGPRGTYSEIAAVNANKFLKCAYDLSPVSTIAKVVDLVNLNNDTIGVLPIENSIEGIVRQTIDNIYSSDVQICAEINIKIEHCLISKGNKKTIKKIISHPQALAQCQRYILDNFDENIELLNSNSTAQGASFLIDKDESYAAIASLKIAEKLNLNVIEKNIGDIKDNKTRFVIISKKDLNILKKTRTSIAFNTKNEPGALLKILTIMNNYNLNLIYLESRPSKKVFAEYNFFADIDKGRDEIREPLELIAKECNYYKMLGSYPCV